MGREQSTLRERVKGRKKTVAAILVASVLLISLGGLTYVQLEQWTTVVYETSGVSVEIGVVLTTYSLSSESWERLMEDMVDQYATISTTRR